MRASRNLARVTFGALIASTLAFGAAQASAPSAGAAAPALACTGAEILECQDACVMRYGEGTSSLCTKVNGVKECTCRP